MKKLPFWFITMAIIYLLFGMSFGIYMSAQQSFIYAPAHGHLNLLGFVLGNIFAFYYHLFDQAISRLAWVHFGLFQVAVILMFPGIIIAVQGNGDGLAKFSSVLAMVAIAVFGYIHLTTRRLA